MTSAVKMEIHLLLGMASCDQELSDARFRDVYP